MKRGKKGCLLGLTGCLTRLLLIIVVETLTAAICFKVLGMNESSTYYTIFAMLCILSAFVLYYDNDDNDNDNEQSQKKAGVGCLLVAALFFFVLACLLNTKNDKEDAANRESTSIPFSSDTTKQRTKTNTGKFYQAETSKDDEEDDDDELYDDPYDNPDFDDLFPGEEYDEEFIDSQGDPELYDEP